MKIAEFIISVLGFSEFDGKQLPFAVGVTSVSKGDIITDYDEIEDKVYFIADGILQAECVTKNLDPKILDFIFPGSLACAYVSFITNQPSKVRLSALTDCRLEVIDREEVQRLYETSLLMNRLARIVAEGQAVHKTMREIDFLTKSAKDRYLDLLKNHPEYIHQIPLNRIALYLGIHPESLSRIRKEVIS